MRYEARSPPLRVTLCHCRFCQRVTGSSHLVEPLFDRDDLRVTSGQPATYRHRSEGSGKPVDLHFCATCGTMLFMTFERFPGLCGVSAGTLDDPACIEVRPDNAKQVFVASARPDAVLLPGLNTFAGPAIDEAGRPHLPLVHDAPHIVGRRRS
ncbi:aldehyde-activating protein [Methylorubrum zatmanii]|nr:aldehyde-activating protein [Methylorubrum zatmanii]